MSDFDTPGVPAGAERWLFVVPSDAPKCNLVLPVEGAGSACGDAAVYQDQLLTPVMTRAAVLPKRRESPRPPRSPPSSGLG